MTGLPRISRFEGHVISLHVSTASPLCGNPSSGNMRSEVRLKAQILQCFQAGPQKVIPGARLLLLGLMGRWGEVGQLAGPRGVTTTDGIATLRSGRPR
ncbi:hypothetical protein INR49_023308 [Caranx melampygus]|nr:hypothetical protein INR49_023308 [Caranx melampygus]